MVSKAQLKAATPFELYKLSIETIEILIEKKTAEKNKMESDGIHDINYAALVNEIGTLKNCHTELMLFFG